MGVHRTAVYLVNCNMSKLKIMEGVISGPEILLSKSKDNVLRTAT